MAWYKRSSRFIVDAFRRHNLKVTAAPRIPLQKSVSTIAFSRRSSSSNSRISGFCQTLLRSFISQNALKNMQRYKSPFLDGSKRFFHSVDTNNKVPEHFKPKGFKFWAGLLGCGVVTTSAYYWNLERVPYTNRSHFVLLSTSLEKQYGDFFSAKTIKSRYEGKILPPLHPLSVRVQRIGHEIVEAAQKGLKNKEECLIVKFFKKLGKSDHHQIPQFEWEFVVVDDPMYDARYLPGGKVVMSTGLLDDFNSDSEIAAFIGHEVGHAIGRHFAERITRLPGVIILNLFLYWRVNLHLIPALSKFLARLPYFQRHYAEKISRLRWCPTILKFFLYLTANLGLIPAISKFMIRLPNSRRREKEADYIGLILVALAGYDPRVVVELMELGVGISFSGWPLFDDYLYTHPTRKKRVQLLSQPKVMDEALSIYREVSMQRRCNVDPHISRNIILDIFRRVLIRDKV